MSIDIYDFMVGVLLLVLTSPFVYALLQQFAPGSRCKFARLVQALTLALLGFVFGSGFSLVLATILGVIGIANYVAETNPKLAFLDPNLA